MRYVTQSFLLFRLMMVLRTRQITQTLYLRKINFVSQCTSPDKIGATRLSISGDLLLASGNITVGEMNFGRFDQLPKNTTLIKIVPLSICAMFHIVEEIMVFVLPVKKA